MINIIQNAITYTSEGKIEIMVGYNYLAQQIEIKVKDTGIGIKHEDHDKVFKILKTDEKIGLGLTISKQIAQKYKGNINFVSEYKKGSTFEFNFELEEFEPGNI